MITLRKWPYLAWELGIAVFAGRYAYVQTDAVTAFAFYMIAALGLLCAAIILQVDDWREPRPPYGGAA